MYRSALLTVDGSEVATAAVAQLPNVVGGEATVLVVEVIDSVGRILAQSSPAGFEYAGAGLNQETLRALVDEQRARANEHLAAARTQLQHAGIRNVEPRVLEGVPGPEIVELAHAEHVDVVVMATHGRSGLTRTVLGSVADYVVRHLRGIPVLLIHPDGESRRTVELQPPIVTAR